MCFQGIKKDVLLFVQFFRDEVDSKVPCYWSGNKHNFSCLFLLHITFVTVTFYYFCKLLDVLYRLFYSIVPVIPGNETNIIFLLTKSSFISYEWLFCTSFKILLVIPAHSFQILENSTPCLPFQIQISVYTETNIIKMKLCRKEQIVTKSR